MFGLNAESVNLPVFNKSYVAGSGAISLKKVCDNLKAGEIMTLPPSSSKSAAALAKGLLITGMLFCREIYSEEDLYERQFGGFYENIFGTVRGLEKMTDILFTVFIVVGPNQSYRGGIDPILFVKQEYQNDVLLVRRIWIKYDQKDSINKEDEMHIISPIDRLVSPMEEGMCNVIDMNATHYCHCVLLPRKGRWGVVTMPEVAVSTPSVEFVEEEDGTHRIGVREEFIAKIVGAFAAKGWLAAEQ